MKRKKNVICLYCIVPKLRRSSASATHCSTICFSIWDVLGLFNMTVDYHSGRSDFFFFFNFFSSLFCVDQIIAFKKELWSKNNEPPNSSDARLRWDDKSWSSVYLRKTIRKIKCTPMYKFKRVFNVQIRWSQRLGRSFFFFFFFFFSGIIWIFETDWAFSVMMEGPGSVLFFRNHVSKACHA